jgi:hypothetical protein
LHFVCTFGVNAAGPRGSAVRDCARLLLRSTAAAWRSSPDGRVHAEAEAALPEWHRAGRDAEAIGNHRESALSGWPRRAAGRSSNNEQRMKPRGPTRATAPRRTRRAPRPPRHDPAFAPRWNGRSSASTAPLKTSGPGLRPGPPATLEIEDWHRSCASATAADPAPHLGDRTPNQPRSTSPRAGQLAALDHPVSSMYFAVMRGT